MYDTMLWVYSSRLMARLNLPYKTTLSSSVLFALLGSGREVGELGCDVGLLFLEALESVGLG